MATAKEAFDAMKKKCMTPLEMRDALRAAKNAGLCPPQLFAEISELIDAERLRQELETLKGLQDATLAIRTRRQVEAVIDGLDALDAARDAGEETPQKRARRAFVQTPIGAIMESAIDEAATAAYWEQYPHEQAMVALRDTLRSLKNNGGDWWAEITHDEQSDCDLLVIMKNGALYAITSM